MPSEESVTWKYQEKKCVLIHSFQRILTPYLLHRSERSASLRLHDLVIYTEFLLDSGREKGVSRIHQLVVVGPLLYPQHLYLVSSWCYYDTSVIGVVRKDEEHSRNSKQKYRRNYLAFLSAAIFEGILFISFISARSSLAVEGGIKSFCHESLCLVDGANQDKKDDYTMERYLTCTVVMNWP